MLVLTKVLIGITIAICICAGVAVALYFGLNNQKSSKTSSNNEINSIGNGEDTNGNGEVNGIGNGEDTNDNESEYISITGFTIGHYIEDMSDNADVVYTDVSDKTACQQQCNDDDSCSVYTYYSGSDGSTQCFLYYDFDNLPEIYYSKNYKEITSFKCDKFDPGFCDLSMISFDKYTGASILTTYGLTADQYSTDGTGTGYYGDGYCFTDCVDNEDCKGIKYNRSTNNCNGIADAIYGSAKKDEDNTYGYAFKVDDN